ncbi:MAG: hypothetical protein PHF56_10245 [Desulfuromonadaceae bacterium]|nr:hypothetical protein [Desulfuromonadaceae bacterium]
MKRFLLLFLSIAVSSSPSFAAAANGSHPDDEKNCQMHVGKPDCNDRSSWCKNREGSCSPEMRGKCGKRRGDWYGARQPVSSTAEAEQLLSNYYAGQEYSVSGVTEKKWGYKAVILDKDNNVIDQVMIDKRSGRIRSLY